MKGEGLRAFVLHHMLRDHAIGSYVGTVAEPRVDRTKDRALLDSIIAIGVVIDGADGWVGLEAFGANKRMWLGQLAVDHKSNEISARPLRCLAQRRKQTKEK
jgi:hypothetical protein